MYRGPGPHQQSQPSGDRERWQPSGAKGTRLRPSRDLRRAGAREVLPHGLPVTNVLYEFGGALERPQHSLRNAAPERRLALYLDGDATRCR